MLIRMMQEAVCLEEGDVLELVTTFLPAPGIDLMKATGIRGLPKPDGYDGFPGVALLIRGVRAAGSQALRLHSVRPASNRRFNRRR